jgi:hypothetical protein
MDPQEQIRSLKEQLAAAEAKLPPAMDAAHKEAVRADGAEATIKTLRSEISELRSQIQAATQVVETEAIKREKVRADAAEVEVRRRDEQFKAALDARVGLERTASIIFPDLNMRGMSDREIVTTVVKRLDAQQPCGPEISDAYLRGRFDSLIDLHKRNARSLQQLGSVITQDNKERADSLDEQRRKFRAQGLEPLPNSREARLANGRA